LYPLLYRYKEIKTKQYKTIANYQKSDELRCYTVTIQNILKNKQWFERSATME